MNNFNSNQNGYISAADRNAIRDRIKAEIKCTQFLKPAPNYRGEKGFYICPACGSGTHKGNKSTGAVIYYPENNTWYCQACKKGGDVIDLFMLEAQRDYSEALEILAEEIGVNLPEYTKTTASEKNDRERGRERREKAESQGLTPIRIKTAQNAPQSAREPSANFAAYYEACNCGKLTKEQHPAAISYLQARGIRPETAAAYRVGYDAKADPANAPGAIENNAQKFYPEPRVIIPVNDSFYIARAIDPAAEFKAPNPKGTKAEPFNLAAIHSDNQIIYIVEGVFDALSFLDAGYSAIALNGKGNGRALLNYLKEHPTDKAFIICPDNDINPATAADTMQHAEELKKGLQNINLRSCIYNVAGNEHDINDLYKKDPELLISNARAAADFLQQTSPDELAAFLEKIQTEDYKPYKTGITFFDNLLSGGIIRQSLLLLLAAPGTGKTTLAQQIAESIADAGKPVLYFNFEMSKEQMLAKAISARLYHAGHEKTALQVLQGYSWTEEEKTAIKDTIETYRRCTYPYIKYNPDGTSSELKSLLTYLRAIGSGATAAGNSAPAIVVDYLQLICSADGLENAELIKQAVTGLKEYAIKYNTFVVGIVATNRESNKKGRVTMESGRDSSNLEYTADYQISLNYEAIDNGSVDPGNVAELSELQKASKRAMILRVLKSRFSQPGKSEKVLFDAAHNVFYGTDDFTPEENAEDIFMQAIQRL